MTSKRQADRGFPLPNPHLGYETICVNFEIPNHPLYRRAIVGHLYDLAQWWTWEKSWIPGDARAKEVSEEFRNLLLQTLSMGECGNQTTGGNVDCIIGQVVSTATAGTPEGFLPCDGLTYLRVDYPELYAALDSNLIIDADHFKTPFIKNGRAPAGVGTYPVVIGGMSGTAIVNVGSELGEYAHTLSIDEIPTHSHDVQTSASTSGGTNSIYAPVNRLPQGAVVSSVAGGSQPHMNVSPITGLRFFIRASVCGGTSSPVTGVRLSGCLMEYTRNGATWFVVPGWDTLNDCIIHPPIPHGMDLRFNNCNLEYSTDSAQTWDTVPGWQDAAACIDTDTPYDLRFRDGVLQWSKNGGVSWAAVDGWEVDQPESELSCRSVRSFVPEFFAVVHDIAFLLNGTSDPYAVAKFNAAAQWPFTEGFGFDAAFDATWNLKQAGDLAWRVSPLTVIGNQIQAAQAFFAEGNSAEWGESDIAAFVQAMSSLPEWAELPSMWIEAAYDYPRELRDWAWGKMAYPIIGAPCVPIEPQDWLCSKDFGVSGILPWIVTMVYGGTQSMDEEGVRLTGDNTPIYKQLEIERQINGSVDFVTFTSRFEHVSGGSDPRREVWARIAGNWVRSTYWQSYSDGTFTDTASVPAGCDAIRLRIQFTTGYTSAWIKSTYMTVNSVENPC